MPASPAFCTLAIVSSGALRNDGKGLRTSRGRRRGVEDEDVKGKCKGGRANGIGISLFSQLTSF
jgi:hypothetical protein